MKKGIRDAWFYFPIIALSIYFIIRLINQSQMIWFFPLDYTNDIPCYLAFLHWFKLYGFHGFVPNWFHGIILFDVYPPGWVFFAYPIYLITKNVLVTSYVSLIIKFILGGFVFYFLGKVMKLSKVKTIAFYCLFFMSPMAIGDFIKQGRLPEMLAWIFFLGIITAIIYYKDRIIDWNFMLIAPLFAALVLTHQAETILLAIVVIGLILTRRNITELFIIGASFSVGLILSSFWWLPFLNKAASTTVSQVLYSKWLLDFSRGFKVANIALVILPAILLGLFYFYWKSHRFKKRELLFFSPLLILSVLVIFRLTLFIPLLKHLYTDPYHLLFLFAILYLFFATDWSRFSKSFKRIIQIGLTLVPIAFIVISAIHTPWFIKPGDSGQELLTVLEEVDGIYNILPMGEIATTDAFEGAVLSYGAIYLNLNSSSGFAYIQAEPEYWENVKTLSKSFYGQDCEKILEYMDITRTEELITNNEGCNFLESCGLNQKVKKEYFCLYRLEK